LLGFFATNLGKVTVEAPQPTTSWERSLCRAHLPLGTTKNVSGPSGKTHGERVAEVPQTWQRTLGHGQVVDLSEGPFSVGFVRLRRILFWMSRPATRNRELGDLPLEPRKRSDPHSGAPAAQRLPTGIPGSAAASPSGLVPHRVWSRLDWAFPSRTSPG
jgi:hypothetical protein